VLFRSDIKLSSENARTLLNHNPTSIRQKALATIIRNRLNHGGILADGAGLIKTGENGRGLMSRWYPETLKKRIMDIAEIKNKIEFVRGDGVDFIEKNLNRKNTVFFIDPPYTKTGKRLYKHHNINHRHLFDLAKNIKGDFLITYDDSQEIETLALDRNFQVERVLMKTTHHTQKYELIIGRELDWLRKMQEV
jgi:DNA adenine methylase